MYTLKTITAALLLVVGCDMGPDYVRPQIDLPNDNSENVTFIPENWWSIFDDAELDRLEKLALKNNADLKQAIANVEIAQAEAGVSFSNLLPSFTAGSTGNKSMVSTKSRSYMPVFIKRNTIDYMATAQISYELDFFGKYRKLDEGARAMLLASRAAKECVRLSITTEIAKIYFLLRALDAKLEIATRTLQTREEVCTLYKNRSKNGYCTDIDYLRIESEIAGVKMVIIDLETAYAKAENAMSVLIGASPKQMIVRQTSKHTAIHRLKIPIRLPASISSSILTKRPDVIQAESTLIASNAKIGEVRAMFFPSISLTNAFGFESKSLADLFSNRSTLWNFSGNITTPIFTGGRLSAMDDMAKANYKKMLAAYEKTAQNAFRESLDAIIVNTKSKQATAARMNQVISLLRCYRIAKRQKDAGLIGLLDLLDVERNLLASEMEFVNSLQNQLNAAVDLCKAFGGGWDISKLDQWK